MKGTIASLIVLALELTICLISSRWHTIEVDDSQICFKNIFVRYNASPSIHRQLRVGPLYSTHVGTDNNPTHIPSNHAKTETILLMTGIALIIVSAISLSTIEFCSSKSVVNRYHAWFHLLNVILLTASLILLIIGFYSLQHILKHPLNGSAAFGVFIGILFIVALATHSTVMFWMEIAHMHNKPSEKVTT